MLAKEYVIECVSWGSLYGRHVRVRVRLSNKRSVLCVVWR